MTTAIGTTAGLDSALRKGFSEASVRVAPDTRMSDIVAAFSGMGISAAVDDGLLILTQGDTTFHTGKALRAFAAKPEQKHFFITEANDPKTWSNDMKMKFISDNGADAWGKKISAPVLEAGIKTLDANMAKSDYLKLTRSEKVAFITAFGNDAVGRIMAKAK